MARCDPIHTICTVKLSLHDKVLGLLLHFFFLEKVPFYFFYTERGVAIYIYILVVYTRCCPANVNMKHYRSHSNFGLVGHLISFWKPKQRSVCVTNAKPLTLPYPHVVNNAYPDTWTLYAQFEPD